MFQLFVMPVTNHDCFLLFCQTLQKEITQNQGDVVLLLKAGNDLLEGREGAAGSDEIQVTILSCLPPLLCLEVVSLFQAIEILNLRLVIISYIFRTNEPY